MSSFDFVRELIVLGLDSVILTLCVREYLGHKRTISALKSAEDYRIDGDLVKHVGAQKNQKIGYAVVRGTVAPIGPAIKSVMTPSGSVTGVLQVIKLSEHRVARGFVGMWVEQQKLIHVSTNDVPFTLSNGNSVKIEIIDALSSELLDLDVVYDNYEPVSNSLFDNIFGFFLGVRQQGLQTTEEILRDGSFITAVGELELAGNQLRLQPSSVGPMMLSTATKNTILRRLSDAKSSSLFKVFVFGTVGLILTGFIARKLFMRRKRQLEERAIKEQLELSRRQRRGQGRGVNSAGEDSQNCVVCITNPKEIICLPCGHVCLCEDCATKINDKCPVCRATIVSKAVAFI